MSNIPGTSVSWVETSKKALIHNIKTLKKLVRKQVLLAPAVKANAYGHGLTEAAKIMLGAGADWLCVNALFEARALREAGIRAPIYLVGYVMKNELREAVRLGCRLVVYNKETIRKLSEACRKEGRRARVHIKIETGNNRQGIGIEEAVDFARYASEFPEIILEGASTHFANIEDVKLGKALSGYPQLQLEKFSQALLALHRAGFRVPIAHCANSAAAMIFPETHCNMVRPGIAAYGLWPSPEVKKAAEKKHPGIELVPALTWKTRIAQIKNVEKGEFIGYGCTYRTKRKTRLAILPVGYYDGYDRGFSNKASVLVHGKRAPVRGRVCMNITMVDVTDIPRAQLEDPVTLLGRDGHEEISAEYLAELIGSINYEITTRIREGIPRVITN